MSDVDRTAVRARESLALAVRTSKLRPSAHKLNAVPRARLLARMHAADTPVTSVIAPAGYGKTILLGQWAAQQRAPVAWVSLDEDDDDPAVLCAGIAAALDRLEPLDPDVLVAVTTNRPSAALLARLLDALESLSTPSTLVVDHLDRVTNPECLHLIAGMASELPPEARMVVSSREQPQLPGPRLRVEGRLLELGTDDLALDVDEAGALLARAGVDTAAVDVAALVARTEGWPAAVYLAALAMRGGASGQEALSKLHGDSSGIGDYLRTEVIDRLSPEDASFVMRSSILDSLSGAVCDATLDIRGSAARLRQLEDRNLLVVSVDDRREQYRYHNLFGQLLRRELHQVEPELEPLLHRRAAAWYEAHGPLEDALRHAQAAGDHDRAARVLLDLIQPVWASGRSETVMQWLDWFSREHLMDRYPALAVHGALMYSLLGMPAQADVWADAAARSPAQQPLPDGSSMESLHAYLRAFRCRDGVPAMISDSVRSYAGLDPASPYRASMLFNEGLAHLIDGDPDAAEPVLIRSVDAAAELQAVPVAAMATVALAMVAAGRGHWDEASELGERALLLIGDGRFDEYWSSALVFAWAARTAVRSGQVDAARVRLARAVRLRPLLTYALPVVSVLTLLEMGRTYRELGDYAGTHTVLDQARRIRLQRPDLGTLGVAIDDLAARSDAAATGFGGSTLTAAELRLAPLLATRLTLQEIGERLFIARSTVKTQAISVYRKLGVSSRREAVDRLHDLGLLA